MSQDEYNSEMERLYQIHLYQYQIWKWWINYYLWRGTWVNNAIAQTKNRVEQATPGYTCAITFPSESDEDIPF